jgi:FkbM family methyltransferase
MSISASASSSGMHIRDADKSAPAIVLSRREIARLPFLPRLRRSLRKRYIRLVHGDQPFIVKYFNSRFIVSWSDVIGREIALQNFERPQIANFVAACRRLRPDCFLDIGAHSGLYSCVLLRANVVGRAILFEPDLRNAALLRANLLINGLLDRATVYGVAAGRQAGRSRLIRGPDNNTGKGRIADHGADQEVEVVALDEATSFSGRTLAIKIDVEGFELEVLAGLKRTLKENRGIAQIESFDHRNDVVEFMRQSGYELVADFYCDLIFEKS